ncbi:hypothetical protein GCM10009304_11370 [Pseudomonas matsuisoli]|uniref:Uncharacterized protein n=1 Tax=Pseudomonas matsuisoli TaxID=1515666 RepID=A0A917UV08_9PSED|nr:hypothetical protein GCM10009304_11370 [Pseudomonas matsuisoli]
MLVYMVAMRVMEVPIVQVIHMTVVLDRGMAAARLVLMCVMGMFVAGAHDVSKCGAELR